MVLGTLLADSLRGQALDDARLSLAQYTNGVLAPHLVRGGELAVGQPVAEVIRAGLAARPDILSVKVWRDDGVLAWTTVARERIGTRFPLDGHLREAIETGEASAELEELGDAEDAAESELGHEHVLEVYARVVGPRGKTIGAFEIYADSAQLEAFVAGRKRVMWLATAGVFAAMWLVLMVLVRECPARCAGRPRRSASAPATCSTRTAGSRRARWRRLRA